LITIKKDSILINEIVETHSHGLIVQLCSAFEKEGIKYCHWKSNAAIDRSVSGDNDLDLLVKRSDIQRFQEILFRLGFKECLKNRKMQLPGVQDYLGYDSQSDRFIHVHAHYQLIIGHDLTKNFHLPIEKPYLESSQPCGVFKVPAPEFELVVFVIRMIIKHSTLDTILMGDGVLSKTEKQELVYLEEKADIGRVTEILNQFLPFISVELFNECLHALRPDCSIINRIRAGYRLLYRLKAQARRPMFEDLILKLWNRFKLSFQWHILKRSSRFRLANGGIVVAIIGGDGAGKTTAIDGLYSWLSRHFDIKKTHMGKPSWSNTTIAVRSLLKLGNLLHLYPFVKVPGEHDENHNEFEFLGFPFVIRQFCTARDRFLTYVKARRFASNGGIVLCDRYPVPHIIPMDGPRINKLLVCRPESKLLHRLNHTEQEFYNQIILPEVLIVLLLNPDIAVTRKPDESRDFVFSRSSLVWEAYWDQTPAVIIDASLPIELVFAELKATVWSRI
jgi:thymidylate kinase